MVSALQILVVEKRITVFRSIENALKQRDASIQCLHLATWSALQVALAERQADCVLINQQLPGVKLAQVLPSLSIHHLTLPIILLLGTELDEDAASKFLHLGAWDFADAKQPERLYLTLRRCLRDATAARARKVAANADSANIAHFQTAIEVAPAAIAMFDRNMNYVAASCYWLEEYGHDRDVLGKNLHALSPDMPESWKLFFPQVLAGHSIKREELYASRDGRPERWLHWSANPWYNALGEIGGIILFTEDMTERRRTLAKIANSESRLRIAKTAAKLGIFDRDIATGIIECDERACEIYGIGKENYLPLEEFFALIHPEDKPATVAAIQRAQDPNGNGEYQVEFRIFNRQDGLERHISATGQALFTDGRPAKLIGAVRDITELKEFERELGERRSEMEALLTQQVAAQTAAAIAHEINQPLVAISAYSEVALRILKKISDSPKELIHALESNREQAQRAGRTLHELIAFLHAGATGPEPLDLNQVMREAIEIAESDNSGKLRLVLSLSPNLPCVLGNRIQVQKILVNLINNGIEASQEKDEPTAIIKITVKPAGITHAAQVTVSDYGPGIGTDIAARIFDPFFTTKPHGNGLGLTISRSLIETNGGQLWLEPKTQAGATFHFTLPFAS